ncbi:MAG: succinyl-diaminopimelate desuccinylase [Egibacteraceae bacterium]
MTTNTGNAAGMAGARPPLEHLLLELLGMTCTTGDEGPIAEWVEHRYIDAGETVRRVGNSVVAGVLDASRPNVALVGHLDVVPPTPADTEPRIDGGRIVGRGASDMKSGLAVAMSCFEDAGLRHGPCNLVLVAYAGEEGPPEGNELLPVLEAVPELRQLRLAIVLEPTDLGVQLGCLGAVHAEIVFRGRAAHAARPWHGANALAAAGPFLQELHELAPQTVTVDDLEYREVVTATQAWTGDAPGAVGSRNVVPAAFTVYVDHRFAPDKDVACAIRNLERLVKGRAEVRPVVQAPAAPPCRRDPAVRAFIDRVGAAVSAKQAWTDVARFTACGVPALNYGPGLTAEAHQAGEHVPVVNLYEADRALRRFLATPLPTA